VDSEKYLTSMIKDMNDALMTGGIVYSTYSNAKIGGALLIKSIKAESWTPSLAEEYQRMLLIRGWKKKNSTPGRSNLLCKEGMLARIDEAPSLDGSRGPQQLVYGFAMSYNLRTRRDCLSS
jgi:hypothetical protein